MLYTGFCPFRWRSFGLGQDHEKLKRSICGYSQRFPIAFIFRHARFLTIAIQNRHRGSHARGKANESPESSLDYKSNQTTFVPDENVTGSENVSDFRVSALDARRCGVFREGKLIRPDPAEPN